MLRTFCQLCTEAPSVVGTEVGMEHFLPSASDSPYFTFLGREAVICAVLISS